MDLFLVLILLLLGRAAALDNGLAKTPPMGWMSWERFRCETNCTTHPDACISERLIKETADVIASEGFRDVGYQYVIVDDCWLARSRDQSGHLQPDPARFPSGIRSLASYVQSRLPDGIELARRGLKFGIYGDIGTHTCGGYPGMQDNFHKDAQTYADWGVDYLKVDGCFADPTQYNITYPDLGLALNKTGRAMVYSCSWPAYLPDPVMTSYQVCSLPSLSDVAKLTPYNELQQHCNLWRNWVDIQSSWQSLSTIVQFWALASQKSKGFTEVARPGSWNDPDMLIIGNEGITDAQAGLQMGAWAIFAAPLIMGNDVRNLTASQRSILLNRGVIAISQDPLGMQGSLVRCPGGCNSSQIWRRQLSTGIAVAFINLGSSAIGQLCLSHVDLQRLDTSALMVQDVFTGELTTHQQQDLCRQNIQPTSIILLSISEGPPAQGAIAPLTQAFSFQARER